VHLHLAGEGPGRPSQTVFVAAGIIAEHLISVNDVSENRLEVIGFCMYRFYYC
jgi:hypothetical protein